MEKKKKRNHSFSLSEKLMDFKFEDIKKIYPSKKSLNLIVGFDCVSQQILLLRMFGLDFKNCDYQSFNYTNSFLSENFYEEFEVILNQYFTTLPSIHSLATYVVLPDDMITMDDIALPIMKANKLFDALTTTIQKEFKNYKELTFNHYIAGKNRQYVVYYVTILRKNYLTKLYKSLSINKMYPKISSYSTNCMVNAILYFKPNYRKKSFIFLDIKEDYTQVGIIVKGKTAGFSQFRLGYRHLLEDKVLQENMQYNHGVADLAIINAKEKARMKQLTIEDDPTDLEWIANSVEEQLNDGINKNEFNESVSKVVNETQTFNEKSLKETAEEILSTYIEDEKDEKNIEGNEEDLKTQEIQEIQDARKKKIFTRKMPKRLPKFMLRDEPTTQEGYLYENFRMFMKWALLYYSQMQKYEYITDFDFILVNMEEKYHFLIDRANSDEEQNPIRFEILDNLGENVNMHLSLIGALFSGLYNKRQNF